VIIYRFIMCVGFIWNNSLVGRCTRLNPDSRAHHALLHIVLECFDLWATIYMGRSHNGACGCEIICVPTCGLYGFHWLALRAKSALLDCFVLAVKAFPLCQLSKVWYTCSQCPFVWQLVWHTLQWGYSESQLAEGDEGNHWWSWRLLWQWRLDFSQPRKWCQYCSFDLYCVL